MDQSRPRAISSWAALDPRDVPARLRPLLPTLGATARPRPDNAGIHSTRQGRRIGLLIMLATATGTLTGAALLAHSILF